jgi:hypothetical protein
MYAEYDSKLTIQRIDGNWWVFHKVLTPSSTDPAQPGEGHWSGEEAVEYSFDTFEEVTRWVEANYSEDNVASEPITDLD